MGTKNALAGQPGQRSGFRVNCTGSDIFFSQAGKGRGGRAHVEVEVLAPLHRQHLDAASHALRFAQLIDCQQPQVLSHGGSVGCIHSKNISYPPKP